MENSETEIDAVLKELHAEDAERAAKELAEVEEKLSNLLNEFADPKSGPFNDFLFAPSADNPKLAEVYRDEIEPELGKIADLIAEWQRLRLLSKLYAPAHN